MAAGLTTLKLISRDGFHAELADYTTRMLAGGVYLAPSAFEAGFTSIAHGDTELKITLDAAERAFAELKKA